MRDIGYNPLAGMPAMPGQLTPAATGRVPNKTIESELPVGGQGGPNASSRAHDASPLQHQETGEAELTSVAQFHDKAGVRHFPFKKKPLQQRQKTTVQERARAARRKTLSRINLNEDEDDELPLRQAASDALATLRGSGEEALEEQLEDEPDPLQRYALLHNALCEVEERDDIPTLEKEELKLQLGGMLKGLMEEHRDEIRKGLKDAQALDGTGGATTASAGMQSASLRDLRFQYGTKGNLYTDSPLTPLAMAKALQQKFGANTFGSALSSLRSKMATEFRSLEGRGMSPRLWLSMSDTAAFTAVQSTFAIASDLRRDLVKKANVLPKVSQAAICVSMLTVVDGGKAKLNGLVTQLFDGKKADMATKGRVYNEVLQAMKRLPTTLWPLDKQGQRTDMLEELGKQITTAYRNIPTRETAVERREREWRAMFNKPDLAPANPSGVAAPAA